MIRIKCPNAKCGKELGIDESKAGAVGACPNCGQKFRIPAASKATAKTPAKDATTAKGAAPKPVPKPGSANANKKHWQADDDFDPYAVKQEVEEKGPPEDDRVDNLVRDDFRNKKREKAWKEVGLATSLMKIIGLVVIGLNLLFFLGISIDVILYNFKMEQLNAVPVGGEKKPDPPEMFVADIIWPSSPGEAPAMLIWLIWFLYLVVVLAVMGLVLAGSEAMKKLENYNLSMTACIVAIIAGIPLTGCLLSIGGVLGLMGLMDDKVKLQFPEFKKEREEKDEEEWDEIEEKKRRLREGLPLHDDDEDEDDDDADDDRPRRKRRKGKKAASSSLASGLILVAIVGGLALVMAALSFVIPEMGIVMLVFGGLALVIARIWVRTIAKMEDPMQGLLVMFVPFYELYFMITRWDECKTPFFLMVGGSIMAVIGGVVYIAASIANEALK